MPLTPSLAAELAVIWSDIQMGVPLFVVRKDAEFLCEGPHDRFDMEAGTADDDTESAIRLFTEKSDAQRYCADWRRLLGDEPEAEDLHHLRVLIVNLQDVWHHLGAIVTNSYVEHQTPPRIELCRLNSVGTPIVLDTLFTEREEMN